jgi:hypothetical protein
MPCSKNDGSLMAAILPMVVVAATLEVRLVFRGSPRRMIDRESQQPSRRPLLCLRCTVLAKVFLALLGAPTSIGTSLLGPKWV